MHKMGKKMLAGVIAATMLLGSVTTAFAATGSTNNPGIYVPPTTEKPEDKPTEKPEDKPTEKPEDKPTEKPEDKPTQTPVKETAAESEKTTSGLTLIANTKTNGTAAVTEVAPTSKTTVTINSKLVVDGVEYKVTKIALGAFVSCEKVKTVTLPATITAIGAEAFTGAPKSLNRINIKSTGKVSVTKTAFKGVDTKKMTIVVTNNMSDDDYNALVKALKAAGYKGKIRRSNKK